MWEDLDADMRADPGIRLKLEEAIDHGTLPPIYNTKRAVVENANGNPIIPYHIFIDGVPYSQTDSIIGVWLVNALTHRRHLVCALRKKMLCQCGCRGWCSFFVIFTYIKFVMGVLEAGVRPLGRHDSQPWNLSEGPLAAKAGEALLYCCVLIFIKGDWMEYAGTFGFPLWSDALRPCFCCNSTVWMLYCIDELSRRNLPWRSNKVGDYGIACARAEMNVVVDKFTCELLDSYLVYDKRDHGNHGLCLTRDVECLGLCKGDRLEPTDALPNVAGLKAFTSFPVPVVFWRTSRETMSRHRNPMLAAELDSDPVDCLTVDTLHALFLGVVESFSSYVVWFVLLSGMFGTIGTTDEQLTTAVHVLRCHLNNWFRQRHAEQPDENLTRPSDFTRSMVGDPTNRVLKLKGAENWSFLLFLHSLMKEAEVHLPPEAGRLIQAAESLINMITIFRTSPCRLSEESIDACWANYKLFLVLTNHLDDTLIPKRHLVVHMLEKLPVFGNPEGYSNWYDEHLNKLLKSACRSVSQVTFETSVLQSMAYLLRRASAPGH